MNAESLYSRLSNLIIAFHGCDQSLVNSSMQITINQMFNFTPPHCGFVVKGGSLIIRNAKGGVHLLCMPSFCIYLINKLTTLKNN